jgi:YHS domain-containing protein
MFIGDVLWMLAIGAFIYYLMKNSRGCCGGHEHGGHGEHENHEGVEPGGEGHHAGHHEMQRQEKTNQTRAAALQDPVCGMAVQSKSASLTSEHLGRTFHFCSEQCRKLFDLHPTRYVKSTQE